MRESASKTIYSTSCAGHACADLLSTGIDDIRQRMVGFVNCCQEDQGQGSCTTGDAQSPHGCPEPWVGISKFMFSQGGTVFPEEANEVLLLAGAFSPIQSSLANTS